MHHPRPHRVPHSSRPANRYSPPNPAFCYCWTPARWPAAPSEIEVCQSQGHISYSLEGMLGDVYYSVIVKENVLDIQGPEASAVVQFETVESSQVARVILEVPAGGLAHLTTSVRFSDRLT